MKRAIVVSVRATEIEDKQTKVKEPVLFVSFCKLPSKMKNGGLWYPKSNDIMSNACFNKARQPDDYDKYKDLAIGTLCDLTFGVNDFNGKSFIASINVYKQSEYVPEDLYI